MTRERSVAVLGMGIMGGAFAGHLVRRGFPVVGFDPDPHVAARARDAGVELIADAAAARRRARFVLCSLPTEAALDATVAALLCKSAGEDPIVIVELSTLSVEAKVRSAMRLAAAGLATIDAPVSGTGAQALVRDIVIYAGGDPSTVEECRPVLEAFAREVHHVGPVGAGTKLKLIANLLVAIHNVATAEAIDLARRAGLDAARACELLAAGVGSSRILQLRGPMMARDAYSPPTMKLGLWQKDLDLITAFAESAGASANLFRTTLPIYAAALEQGYASEDTAVVYRVLSGRGDGDTRE